MEITKDWLEEQIELIKKDITANREQYHNLLGGYRMLLYLQENLQASKEPAQDTPSGGG